MSRTVADATRFTATSPHAYSKPSSILRSAASAVSKTYSPSPFTSSGSARKPSQPTIPSQLTQNPTPLPQRPGQTPPPNETPQQKVARLRALRAAEKLKPLGLWDRTVIRGRRWADIAHRTTVYGFMGISVIAFTITAFSLTDMIIYNRNQRALYYAAQESIYTETLRSAIAAEQESRPLTSEETSVLNREKMVLKAEADRERLKEIGWWKRVKAYFAGEDVLGSSGSQGLQGMEGVEAAGPILKIEDIVGQERILSLYEEKKKEQEGGTRVKDRPVEDVLKEDGRVNSGHVENVLVEEGGPLDRIAEDAVKAGTEKAKGGWSSWFGGSR